MISLNKHSLSEPQQKFANHINIPVSDKGYTVEFVKADKLSVLVLENKIEITYSAPCEIYRALALLKTDIKIGEKIAQPRNFNSLAAFLDCSRNAVMKPEAVKNFIMDIAALGYNQLYLYTEDTYEIPDEPYFGHLRGRYTADEIKEIDVFAKQYGIELIPAIQTLSHLYAIFRWKCFAEVGAQGTLHCGNEKAYQLIDKMFASLRGMYSTDKINIGMDEAHNLGENGMEKFLNHLQRVCEIAAKYGFKPTMWSDMLFKMANGKLNYDQIQAASFEKTVLDSIPKEVGLVYWNYEPCTAQFYDEMIKSHVDMGKHILFAGGAKKWLGFCPQITDSLTAARNALPNCKKHNIKDVIITGWGDCGAEASAYTMLPALVLWAEECYISDMSDENLSKKLSALFGYSLADFLALEKTNKIINKQNGNKLLLYNDPIIGLFDKHIPDSAEKECKDIADELAPLVDKQNRLAYVFETVYLLARFLEMKVNIGKKIRAAYKVQDKSALRDICDSIPEMIKRLDIFHSTFRKNWLKENKIFGFDVQDIRLGALRARLCYVKDILDTYLNGEISMIEELCAEPLNADCHAENGTCALDINIWRFDDMISPSVMS